MGAPVSDNVALRMAFAQVPSAVVAICAETGSERIGMAASTFMPVSLDPPLAAFCVQNTSTTWPRLAALLQAGDHTIVVLHINTLHCRADNADVVEPIVFHRSGFRRLVAS